jgi:hypothetical protein
VLFRVNGVSLAETILKQQVIIRELETRSMIEVLVAQGFNHLNPRAKMATRK